MERIFPCVDESSAFALAKIWSSYEQGGQGPVNWARAMNDIQEQELRELLVRAFADAKAKGKADWQTMELSVLKNRVLQRTERRFRETDYGGKTCGSWYKDFPTFLL